MQGRVGPPRGHLGPECRGGAMARPASGSGRSLTQMRPLGELLAAGLAAFSFVLIGLVWAVPQQTPLILTMIGMGLLLVVPGATQPGAGGDLPAGGHVLPARHPLGNLPCRPLPAGLRRRPALDLAVGKFPSTSQTDVGCHRGSHGSLRLVEPDLRLAAPPVLRSKLDRGTRCHASS